MTPPPPPQRWQKLGRRSLAVTRILELTLTGFRHPGRATEREFVVIDAPDWVNVVALTPAHQLVLVRQFRYGSDEFSLEVPGGVIDAGEDPLAAGVRELREETGFTGGAPVRLGTVHPNPAMQSNRCHLILIPDARPTEALEWDGDEEFEILTVPVEEAYARAYRGEITHAMALDALLLFRPHWERLRTGPAV